VAASDASFKNAVTTALCETAAAPARAVKLTVSAPAATATDAGTVSALVLLESVTLSPPEPAALERVSMQVDEPPGRRLAGVHESKARDAGGATWMGALRELPL